MGHESQLDLTLFPAGHYTWNDDLTERMSAADKVRYFTSEAEHMMGLTEYEVAYGILRELIDMAPRGSRDVWLRLKTCCKALGHDGHARAVAANARVLE